MRNTRALLATTSMLFASPIFSTKKSVRIIQLLSALSHSALPHFPFQSRSPWFVVTTTTRIIHTNTAERSSSRNNNNNNNDKNAKPHVPYGYWKNFENHRKFFDELAREFNISKPEDWYRITLKDINSRGGKALLTEYYGGSLVQALRAIYPEHTWRSPKVPRGFWNDPSNHRRFFDKLAAELGVKQPSDWSKFSTKDVLAKGAGSLLNLHYAGSLPKALRAVYPEYNWDVLAPSRAPSGFWQDPANRRRFFDKLAQDLGIAHLDDWYDVSAKTVHERGGKGILNVYYGGSLPRALQSVYPEHPWQQSRFRAVPRGFWTNPENHRQFFDQLARELDINKPDDWYDVTVGTIHARGGGGLLNQYYGGSLIRALQSVYPEHDWKAPRVPTGHWSSAENQRKFFDDLSKDLGLAQLDDWYGVPVQEVIARGGAGVLSCYAGSSLASALQAIYPEHAWVSWRFPGRSRAGSSITDGQLQEYIAALAEELSIKHLDDWYRVSLNQIRRFGGYRYFQHNGGLPLVLKRLYPHHNWDETKFVIHNKKSSQRWLREAVRRLFPDTEILEDYLHPALNYKVSQLQMELDIYVPSLRLAFEFHGVHHYQDIHVFGDHAIYIQQDQEKTAACRAAGLTLIVVPHWWDGTLQSLGATIRAARPDLLVDAPPHLVGPTPIPLQAPANNSSSTMPQPTTNCKM